MDTQCTIFYSDNIGVKEKTLSYMVGEGETTNVFVGSLMYNNEQGTVKFRLVRIAKNAVFLSKDIQYFSQW